ncbi:hypothetical protein DHEL01_v208542 [Diaporthe helianthi]|uniref:Uncharacterized protein n=1 Tax=Diaporthe helianthi TaxID=158607 RepID=A0A2P5HS35_DIAHE|nr:hypothetical protein DHEL01_v208542 [Diaporthe helianthi]
MAGEMRPASRYHLLTNPVAEYLETGQSQAPDGTAPWRPGPDFVPEMDQFVPKGFHSIREYHQESHAHMQEFEKTLLKFHGHLGKRKDRDNRVQLKDPSEYTFKDVLDITTKLQEDHQSASQVKSCMGLVRKMFRVAGEKSSVLENLLNFVPSDSYGSAICGGFTMILTAAQRTHELREEICAAISEIPKKLGHIHRQLRVHYSSPNLHACADGILVAMFIVLERIVAELTKSLSKKVFMATIKGSDYADDIKDAIKTLATRVDEFDSEARICDSARLGRLEQNDIRTMIAIESITERVRQQMKQDKEEIDQKLRLLETQALKDKRADQDLVTGLSKSVVQEALQIAVSNACYRFLMAHPNIDNRTGKMIASPENFNFKALQASPQQNEPQPSSIDLWLQELAQPQRNSPYIDKCLENIWGLSLKEMDRVKYIMASAELRSWLRSSRSAMLIIDSETRPDDVFNALTSSIAIVTHTLILEANFPVLSFFCGLHANEVYDEHLSGPIGLLNCLNAQLLSYFKEQDVDTTVHQQLQKPKFRRRSQNKVSKSLELFEIMLNDLSESDPVVIVVDSACRLRGSRQLANQAIRGLLQVAGKANRVVKILISSPWSTDELGLNGFDQLYIPDYIDGDREGLNLELAQKDAAEAAKTSKAKDESSEDSESTVSNSDSDDDWAVLGSSRW